MVAAIANLYPSNRAIEPVGLSRRTIHVLDHRPSRTTEDLRIHAWINERLAAVHRERYSLWARVRRLLFGDRPI